MHEHGALLPRAFGASAPAGGRHRELHYLVPCGTAPARLRPARQRAEAGAGAMSLAPLRVLVTGAGSGIGAALCRRIAGRGVRILVHTRSRQVDAEAVAAECRSQGAECVVALGELAEPETAARLVAAMTTAFGGLDALVANAGFADRRLVGELDDAGFRHSMDAILTGFFRLADAGRTHIEG